MNLTWLDRFLAKHLRYFEVTSKEIGANEGDVYLRRYYIYTGKYRPHIYIHHFLESDYDRAMHDHPWGFTTVMLWGGYWEHVPTFTDFVSGHIFSKKTWYGPGTIRGVKANHIHRVELPEGKTAWTLMIVGPRERDWGFWIKAGKWCFWRKYDLNTGICEEDFVHPANKIPYE
jgi:hypothetical protein